jgi:hypothetical protein
MVGDEPVSMGQTRLGKQGPETVLDEGSVDENHRLAGAYSLIFKRHAVDNRSLHAPSSATRRPLSFRLAQ